MCLLLTEGVTNSHPRGVRFWSLTSDPTRLLYSLTVYDHEEVWSDHQYKKRIQTCKTSKTFNSFHRDYKIIEINFDVLVDVDDKKKCEKERRWLNTSDNQKICQYSWCIYSRSSHHYHPVGCLSFTLTFIYVSHCHDPSLFRIPSDLVMKTVLDSWIGRNNNGFVNSLSLHSAASNKKFEMVFGHQWGQRTSMIYYEIKDWLKYFSII